jgi:hypothetical protein
MIATQTILLRLCLLRQRLVVAKKASPITKKTQGYTHMLKLVSGYPLYIRRF